jgi:hypothetical protein
VRGRDSKRGFQLVRGVGAPNSSQVFPLALADVFPCLFQHNTKRSRQFIPSQIESSCLASSARKHEDQDVELVLRSVSDQGPTREKAGER